MGQQTLPKCGWIFADDPVIDNEIQVPMPMMLGRTLCDFAVGTVQKSEINLRSVLNAFYSAGIQWPGPLGKPFERLCQRPQCHFFAEVMNS